MAFTKKERGLKKTQKKATHKIPPFFKGAREKKKRLLFFRQISEKRKIKSDFLLGKRVDKIIDGKGLSAPQKLSDF